MADRQILFSGAMVRGLLREIEAPGTGKTMTRRMAWRVLDGEATFGGERPDLVSTHWWLVRPGDRLWVRERTKCIAVRGEEIKVRYDADGYEPGVWLPFPSRLRFTPRAGELLSMGCYLEASRITLDVSATKIERLQQITNADAKLEGVDGLVAFRELWIKLHGEDGFWSNPEVVALTFTPHRVNILNMDKK